MTTREMRRTLIRFFGPLQWQLSESDGIVRVDCHRTTSHGMRLWDEFASGATVEAALRTACRKVYEILNNERMEAQSK